MQCNNWQHAIALKIHHTVLGMCERERERIGVFAFK